MRDFREGTHTSKFESEVSVACKLNTHSQPQISTDTEASETLLSLFHRFPQHKPRVAPYSPSTIRPTFMSISFLPHQRPSGRSYNPQKSAQSIPPTTSTSTSTSTSTNKLCRTLHRTVPIFNTITSHYCFQKDNFPPRNIPNDRRKGKTRRRMGVHIVGGGKGGDITHSYPTPPNVSGDRQSSASAPPASPSRAGGCGSSRLRSRAW